MLKRMTDTLGPLDPQAVQKAEQLIGGPLPDAYKQFLQKYNGGRPEPTGFSITWSGQEWADGWSVDMVHVLLGFKPDDPIDFFHYLDMFMGRVPVDTVPVGCDPGGNLLLLGFAGPNAGKVFFWMRDYEVEEGQVPDYSNVGFVASSFSEFLEGLFEP
jgi:SMI1-KNR4 cell-wall